MLSIMIAIQVWGLIIIIASTPAQTWGFLPIHKPPFLCYDMGVNKGRNPMSITVESVAKTLMEGNTPWEYETLRNGKPLRNNLQQEIYFDYEDSVSELIYNDAGIASDFRDWCLEYISWELPPKDDEFYQEEYEEYLENWKPCGYFIKDEILAWSDEECIANVGVEELSETLWHLAGEVASCIEGYWYENDIPNPYQED